MPQPVPPQTPSEFLFVICQNGAESALRNEILSNHPEMKLAFSQPGFVTFKIQPGAIPFDFTLKSPLARTAGWSLGKLQGENATELADQISQIDQFKSADRIHIFERDPWLPGRNHFEPGVSPLAAEIAGLMTERLPAEPKRPEINSRAKSGETVFDVVLVQPNQWWYGVHIATPVASRWPGGVPQIDVRREVFSRAYFKLSEALLWSGIRVQPGDVCAELGSAPGGACQLLLEKGAKVIGIDPAEMEPALLEDKNFTHIRRRGTEVRIRDLKSVQWLMSDMNTDPEFTLEVVENLLSHDSINPKGLILTMKLSEWDWLAKVPTHIQRVRKLGFQIVKVRQLAFNRREYCLAAIKNKFVQRNSRRRKKSKPAEK